MASTSKCNPLHYIKDPWPPPLNGPFSHPTTLLNLFRICFPTHQHFPLTSIFFKSMLLYTLFIFPQTQANGMRNVIPAIWIQSTGVKILFFVALIDSPAHGHVSLTLDFVLPQSLSHSFLPSYCFLMPGLLELSLKFRLSSSLCTYKNWLYLPEQHFSHFTWIFFPKDLENVHSYLEKSPLTVTFNLTLHLACQFLSLLWSGPYENLTSKVESFQFLEEKK